MLVSVCQQSFLCVWPQGTFFFFPFSQHLNLEKPNLEILSKVKMKSVFASGLLVLLAQTVCVVLGMGGSSIGDWPCRQKDW